MQSNRVLDNISASLSLGWNFRLGFLPEKEYSITCCLTKVMIEGRMTAQVGSMAGDMFYHKKSSDSACRRTVACKDDTEAACKLAMTQCKLWCMNSWSCRRKHCQRHRASYFGTVCVMLWKLACRSMLHCCSMTQISIISTRIGQKLRCSSCSKLLCRHRL